MIAILAAISCTNGTSGTPASGVRISSPTTSGVTADSKAADLRARLDTLLGEHVMVIAKASLASAANRADEYKGYATLITLNASDLADVMSSAFGTSAGTRFGQIWAEQNNYFVDYTVGIVSHNAPKSNGAASGLVNGFLPKFGQYMSSMTSIPLDPITQLAALTALSANADGLGTLFSPVFGSDIGTRFDQVWNARDAELVVYASNASAANRQAASDSLSRDFVSQFTSLVRDSVDITEGAIGHPVQSQLVALIKVIDDQRSKAAGPLAADDHTAASATYPIADVIANAAVAKLPAKFGVS